MRVSSPARPAIAPSIPAKIQRWTGYSAYLLRHNLAQKNLQASDGRTDEGSCRVNCFAAAMLSLVQIRPPQPKFLESCVARQPHDLQRQRPRPLCPVRTRSTIEWNWVDSQLLREIDCSLHYNFCSL